MKKKETSALANWTPEEIEQGKRWVESWKVAGEVMERLRREDLRKLDGYAAIEALCFRADYPKEFPPPKPSSGLVEQQHLFMKAYKN